MSLVTGPWTLADLNAEKIGFPKNGLKVFSCFHCGGGSTMGYKLAGFDVLGGVEIDPKMMEVYRKNFNPKHSYLMGIQEFKNIPDSKLPKELFDLDILDGSPPCSSFSMAGSREKDWGKKKKFREGQSEQVLDDLFFDFIDVAKKLQPKVVVAENVKGLIQGNARGYVKEIFQRFRMAGYETQLFLLNASCMGVPQARERTFFIAVKKDRPKIKLSFTEPVISLESAFIGIDPYGVKLTEMQYDLWKRTLPGKAFSTADKRGFWFGAYKAHPKRFFTTLTAQGGNSEGYMWDRPRKISPAGHKRIQSFADDFDFLDNKSHYICGMSVPPLMMQRIADQIAKQIFKKNL